MFSQPVAQLMWFFKWKVTIIGKVMDFLQTKCKPWSHSLFIYLFTHLFYLPWRKWGRSWAGGGKLLVLWRGGDRKSKPPKRSRPQGTSLELERGREEAEAAARTRRGRDTPRLGGEDRCNLSFTNNVEAAHYFGTLSPTPPHFGARRNDSCLPKMANNVRLLTSFGAAACWVSKCLIPFGFVWCFQPVTSLSFVPFLD